MKRTLISRALVASVALGATSCSPPSAGSPTPRVEANAPWSRPSTRRSVVLVAIDGVRWQDVFGGVDRELAARRGVPEIERAPAAELVPNLTKLMAEGAVVGAPGAGLPILASGPEFLSMPGYSEIFTGRRVTGCHDNSCGRIGWPTIADDIAREGIGRAAVVTSWPNIERAAAAFPGNADMSVGRHEGPGREAFDNDPATRAVLQAGENSGPDPGFGDFRNDEQTARLALAVYDAKRPSFLFVGLGETDEFAHREDYRGYLDALRRADRVIGQFARVVLHPEDASSAGTLIVTTDHGRSIEFGSHGGEHPESARVWLVAAGAGIAARGAVSSPETRHLANVAPTVRAILGIAQPPETEDPLVELFEPARGVDDQRAASN